MREPLKLPKDRAEIFPYFPFYVDDFLDDEKVEAMTTEEVGAYILLLLQAWKQVPAGTLPTSDRILARWARVEPEKWASIRGSVLAPFRERADGRLHQPRMILEHRKISAAYERKRDGGVKGAKSRWKSGLDGSPNDKPDSSPNNLPNAREEKRREEKITSLARAEDIPVQTREPAADASPRLEEEISEFPKAETKTPLSILNPLALVCSAIAEGTGRAADPETATELLFTTAEAGIHPHLLAAWIGEFCQQKRAKGDPVKGAKLLLAVWREEYARWFQPRAGAYVGGRLVKLDSKPCSSCSRPRVIFADGLMVSCDCKSGFSKARAAG